MKKLIVSLLVLTLTFTAFASYWVEDAEVGVILGKNAVHTVKETYTFNYETPQHGFFRYIPVDYSYLENPVHAKISNLSCSDAFNTYEEDTYCVLQVGSSSRKLNGLNSYSISYNYDLGADMNEGYDEFYLNLWGADWEVPVSHFRFSVFVPLSVSDCKIWAVRGSYGSQNAVDCYVAETEGGFVVYGEAESLSPYEAVTIRIQMPDGFYEGARQMWDYRGAMQPVSLVLCTVLLAAAVIAWMMNGRDPVPIISAKFDPPQGMTPVATGYLVDGSVDDRDITSMLFYWADKGYMEIEEPKKNRFVFIHKKDLPSSAPKAEQTLFYGLFNCSKTDSVTLEQLQIGNFYEKMQKAKLEQVAYFRKERSLSDKKCNLLSALFTVLSVIPVILLCLSAGLYEFASEDIFGLFFFGLIAVLIAHVLFANLFRKWYARKSNTSLIILITLLSVFFIGLGSVLANEISGVSTGLAIYCLSCSILTAFFARIMPKRSEYGRKLFEDVLGYREFIDKVSMSELILLIDQDPQYYYHVLSYAIALGLEDKWAKKFESVTVPGPYWYRGITPFDVYFYSTLSTRMRVAVKASAIPPNVKNSNHIGGVGGGFNIGGFAGGGFGGGGGHAW